jgi:hypothetical protein
MLNQPSIFEAANIEHTEIHGLAASHLLTSRSHADPILSDKLKPRAVCHDAREASSRVPRNWWRINRLAPGLDSPNAKHPARGRRGILGTRDFFPHSAEPLFDRTQYASVLDLLRSPSFRWLIVVASLILGSHVMHDSFAMIAWNAAGISPAVGSALWSESVAAEVIVFVAVGPFLLHRLKPEIAMAVSATACLVRWALLAESTSIVAIAAAEPLHGFTFALLHLSCMRVLATIVPRELAGLAPAIHGTVGAGPTPAVLTFFSGSLYTEFGAQGFWAMFLIALSALPAIWRLYRVRT